MVVSSPANLRVCMGDQTHIWTTSTVEPVPVGLRMGRGEWVRQGGNVFLEYVANLDSVCHIVNLLCTERNPIATPTQTDK